LSSDNHPGPLATLAEHCVEFSPAQSDRAAVGEGHSAACRFDSGHEGAFGGQVRFHERGDIVHARTIGSDRLTVNEIGRLEVAICFANRIN
jgi:hypothetical protein